MSTIAAADLPHMDPELVRLVERTRGLQPWRRVFHACNGLLLVFLPPLLGIGGQAVAWILGGTAAVLLLADAARLHSPRMNARFFSLFPALASPREADSIASSTWYAAGCAVAFALFPTRVAVPAVLMLALADPTASVVGRMWGRRALGKGTVLGSAAFLAVSFGALAAFVTPAAALLAAALVTLVEVIPWRLDDNFTIPVSAAALLWMLGA